MILLAMNWPDYSYGGCGVDGESAFPALPLGVSDNIGGEGQAVLGRHLCT